MPGPVGYHILLGCSHPLWEGKKGKPYQCKSPHNSILTGCQSALSICNCCCPSPGPPHITPGAQKPHVDSALSPSDAVDVPGPCLLTALPGSTSDRAPVRDDCWLDGTCCCKPLALLALLGGCGTVAASGLLLLIASS